MTDDALYTLIWNTRPLLQQIEASVARFLDGTGLTIRMRAVLEILHRGGPMSVPDLARSLDIQRQYVQLMVNETDAAQLTLRLPNPQHKRSPLIGLTDRGSSVISEIIDREARLVRSLGDGLAADDIATALRVQHHLLSALRERNETHDNRDDTP